MSTIFPNAFYKRLKTAKRRMYTDGINNLEYKSRTEIQPGFTKIIAKFVAPVVPKFTEQHCVDHSRNFAKHQSLVVTRSKGDMRRSYNKAFGAFNKFHKIKNNTNSTKNVISWKASETILEKIGRGGVFKPEKCEPTTQFAILALAVNNKTENDLWIQWTHNTLVRQGVGYQLFLIRPGFCVDIRGEALKNSTQKFTHILITNVGEALVTDNCLEKLTSMHSGGYFNAGSVFKTKKTAVQLKKGSVSEIVEDNVCLYQQIDLEKALKVKSDVEQVFCDGEGLELFETEESRYFSWL